jgi:hypothetical protein
MKAESGEKKVVENYHKDITSGHHPGRATSSLLVRLHCPSAMGLF